MAVTLPDSSGTAAPPPVEDPRQQRRQRAGSIVGYKEVSADVKSRVAARKVTDDNRDATNVEKIRVEKKVQRARPQSEIQAERAREDAAAAEQRVADADAQVARNEAVDEHFASAAGHADEGGPGLPLARLAPGHALVAAATTSEERAAAVRQARQERLARTRANLQIGGAPDKASQERLASDEAQGMIKRSHETLGFVDANARKVSPP